MCLRTLAESPSPEEKVECSWIFANVCLAGHAETMAVVPAVPLLASCMSGGEGAELAEHAAWTIGAVASVPAPALLPLTSPPPPPRLSGNIAADSAEARAALQRPDVVAPLLACMRSHDRRLAATAAWACSFVIRGPGVPDAVPLGGACEQRECAGLQCGR